MALTKKKVKIIIVISIVVLLLIIDAFYYLKPDVKQREEFKIFKDENGKIIVSAASFPVYDFAKEIGGDKIKVNLLLPPGIEAHSFRPTNKELSQAASSSLVFYVSPLFETWLDKLNAEVKTVAVADSLIEEGDPHVWLDFTKATVMTDNITKAYQMIDPINSSYYQIQADNYKDKLQTLDQLYFASLKNCQFRDLIQGGHQAFSYLTRRYNLNYLPAQGVVPQTDLDMDKISAQIEKIKSSGQEYIYYEELIMPSLAEVVRQRTGVKMILLNSAHNVARFDIEGGLTFIKIMENNLESLKLGLSCQ
jgi:zinc transport system substrate-binding protein